MKTLIEILISLGLVALEFLAVAMLVAPRTLRRGLDRLARAARGRLMAGAAAAREDLEKLINRHGRGTASGRLA